MGAFLFVSLTTAEWTSSLRYAVEAFSDATVSSASIDDARHLWTAGQFDALILAADPESAMHPPVEPLLRLADARLLAALPRGGGASPEWLELAGEVLFWPAETAELEFRMARFAPRTPSAPARSDDPLMRLLAAAELVGESAAFRDALAMLPTIIRYDAPVVVSGETGTGKDLVARAIHYLGPRKGGPYVPVNCAALPEALFENELFGHIRGAYTTAGSSHDGLAAQANGGTLFLDEVDTLSLRSQAALLRFLQDGHYRPLGAGAGRVIDTRVLAATNADLRVLMADGRFRSDLFHRLHVLRLTLPPLRDRRDDIPMLADHLVKKISRRYRGEPKRLSPTARHIISTASWPGNVRELENWLHRHYLMSSGPLIHGGETVAGREQAGGAPGQTRFGAAKRDAIAAFERQYLSDLIAATRGNVSAASRESGTERRMLARLMRKHGIDPAAYR